MANENKNIESLNNDQISGVSGGGKGLFKTPEILKTYCDYCKERIDGKSRYMIPVIKEKGTMCNECFEKQKASLGIDAANRAWLGIVPEQNQKGNKLDLPSNKIHDPNSNYIK